jgi:radical SAM superfamily enzyme YgiQ (UPF0313 family)
MADIIVLSGGRIDPEDYPRLTRSLGPYRITSELKKHGYDAIVIDYTQYMSVEEVNNAVNKHLTKNTLWVGYSSTFFTETEHFPTTPIEIMYQSNSVSRMTSIIDNIKKNSTAKIVFGGAYALGVHADKQIDYYIAGYADNAVVDLTNFLAGKVDKMQAAVDIVTADGGNSVFLDSAKYPEPAMSELQTFWHDDNVNLVPGEGVAIEFARGCIFKCKFCSYPLLGKKKGTYIRDMEEVRDEITKLWETRGTEHFYITDDTFNDDNDKMESFHKLFTSLPFKPKFSCFLRLDLIHKFPHQADLLLEAGMVGNFFGIETFNHKNGKVIGKGLHPDKTKETLIKVRDKWRGKVNTGVGLIFGLPYDDHKYFEELWSYIHSSDYDVQSTSFNTLFIVDKTKGYNLYESEFSMNPEIYGYTFDEYGQWVHKEQGLDFVTAMRLTERFHQSMRYKEQVADFQIMSFMNLGIPLHDILALPKAELCRKYDIAKLNDEKIMKYKQMIGAM